MLKSKTTIQLNNPNIEILTYAYSKAFTIEYTILSLSNNTILINYFSSVDYANYTETYPWFKHKLICSIKLDDFGTNLYVLSIDGYLMIIPMILFSNKENKPKWENLISTVDPIGFLRQEAGLYNTNNMRQQGTFSKLAKLFSNEKAKNPSNDDANTNANTNTKSDFADIKIIEIKYSNFSPENEDSIRTFKHQQQNASKDNRDYYNSFTDFIIWDSFSKERFIIVINLSGGLFIISEYRDRQILLYKFPFGLVSIKLITIELKKYLIIENDIGEYLKLNLEAKSIEKVQTIFNDGKLRKFQPKYTKFLNNSRLFYDLINQKHNELIEYSESNSLIRIFKPSNIKRPKIEYYIFTLNLKYIINWDRFFVIVKEEKTGITFDIIMKYLLKTKPKDKPNERHTINNHHKSLSSTPPGKLLGNIDGNKLALTCENFADIEFLQKIEIVSLSPELDEKEEKLRKMEISLRKNTKLRDEDYINSLVQGFKYLNKPFEGPNSEILMRDCIQGEAKLIDIVSGNFKPIHIRNIENLLYLHVITNKAFKFVELTLENLISELEKKILAGNITKDDYITFDNFIKTHTQNFTHRLVWVQKRLKNLKRYDVIFDIEIYDKIKFQEKIINSFDFKECICNHIDNDNLHLKMNIIKLITEKMILDIKIDHETLTFYVIALFYCIIHSILANQFGEIVQLNIVKFVKQALDKISSLYPSGYSTCEKASLILFFLICTMQPLFIKNYSLYESSSAYSRSMYSSILNKGNQGQQQQQRPYECYCSHQSLKLNLKDYPNEKYGSFSVFIKDFKSWINTHIEEIYTYYTNIDMIIVLILQDNESFKNWNLVLHIFKNLNEENKLYIIYKLVFRLKFLRRRNFKNISKDLDDLIDILFTFKDNHSDDFSQMTNQSISFKTHKGPIHEDQNGLHINQIKNQNNEAIGHKTSGNNMSINAAGNRNNDNTSGNDGGNGGGNRNNANASSMNNSNANHNASYSRDLSHNSYYTSEPSQLFKYYFSNTEEIIGKRYKGPLFEKQTKEQVLNKETLVLMILDYLKRMKIKNSILEYVGMGYLSILLIWFIDKKPNKISDMWFDVFKILIIEFIEANSIELLNKIMFTCVDLDNIECLNLVAKALSP